MINLQYYIEGDEDRPKAILAVKTLAAAYNIEVTFPNPPPEPGDIPG